MPCEARRLEIIVTDEREARIAQSAGADRLELVAAFDRGGLSPSPRTVAAVLAAVEIPIRAMVRPHDFGFCYGAEDRRTILETAQTFGRLGVRGLVFGALRADGRIDTALLADVLAEADRAEVTFHRAFDVCADPHRAYAEISGFPRVTHVLSGGGERNAVDGAPLLRDLVTEQRRPAMLVGGGVTAQNVRRLLEITGAREFHVGSGARTGSRVDGRKIGMLAALLKG